MKTLLKFSILFIIIFCFTQKINGQNSIIGISPSKLEKVNGLMINVYPKDYSDSTNFPTINGIELGVCPLTIFFPFLIAIYSLDPDFHQPLLDHKKFQNHKKINGVHVSFFNMEPTLINGLDINASGSFESNVNGITCSLVINKHHNMNGLTIAILGNHDTKCNGVQVGLFNSSKKLRGFQFGLWNKNEKRSLPFINWNFGKK